MAGAFEEDVEKTVTIDEYLEDVEAQELVNFVVLIFICCCVFCCFVFRVSNDCAGSFNFCEAL